MQDFMQVIRKKLNNVKCLPIYYKKKGVTQVSADYYSPRPKRSKSYYGRDSNLTFEHRLSFCDPLTKDLLWTSANTANTKRKKRN